MGSLQDALLKTGLAREEQARKKKAAAAGQERPPKSKKPHGKFAGKPRGKVGARTDRAGTSNTHPGKRAPSNSSRPPSSDLERAYAARRKAEQEEKERVKRERVADQEQRRKRNLELDRIVDGKALNESDAELPRYFEHIGRIRRVLCTPQQREGINEGRLGVVNLRGRYLIVLPEVLEAYRALAPDLVPDLGGPEPDGDAEGDYPPVPDDLTW